METRIEVMMKRLLIDQDRRQNIALDELENRMMAELSSVRADMKSEFRSVKTGIRIVKAEIRIVKTGMKNLKIEIGSVKADLRSEIMSVTTDMKSEFKSALDEQEKRVTTKIEKRMTEHGRDCAYRFYNEPSEIGLSPTS